MPVQSDPLVLERTVNHLIYGRRTNGNGNGNGNGHDDNKGAFLYTESDLKRIVFPTSEEAAPAATQDDAAASSEQTAAQTSAQNGNSISSSQNAPAPAAPVARPWEAAGPMNRAALFGAAAGTPMAAGAAHALAAIGAQAAAAAEAPPVNSSARSETVIPTAQPFIPNLSATPAANAPSPSAAATAAAVSAPDPVGGAASAPASSEDFVPPPPPPEAVPLSSTPVQPAPWQAQSGSGVFVPKAEASNQQFSADPPQEPNESRGDFFSNAPGAENQSRESDEPTSSAVSENANSFSPSAANSAGSAAEQSASNPGLFSQSAPADLGPGSFAPAAAPAPSPEVAPNSFAAAAAPGPGFFAPESAAAAKSEPERSSARADLAPTSAQASSRPGLMDFFSATSSEGGTASGAVAASPSANSREKASDSSFSSGSSSSGAGARASTSEVTMPSFMSGAQASIIQNAIQAAATLNAQSSTSSSNSVLERKSDDSASDDAKKAKKGVKKKNLRPVPKAEDEDEDEDFSTGRVKAKTAAKLPARKRDDDEKFEPRASGKGKAGSKKTEAVSRKVGAKSSKAEPPPKIEAKDLQVMGFSLPMKFLKIAGVLLVFVGFPLMVLVANITSLVGPFLGGGGAAGPGANPAAIASSNPGLSGEWTLAFENTDGTVGQGAMSITQNGDVVDGFGVDRSGQFQLKGKVDGAKLVFNKQYIQGGQLKGKPIIYAGRLDMNNPSQQYLAHISGIWRLTKKQGYGWRAQVVDLQGKWEAGLTKRTEGGAGAVAYNNVASPKIGGGPGVPMPAKDPNEARDFFMKVAFGIIGTGIVMAMVSLRFFGPSGLLNIWAKKKYIPSQFTSQHYKMVAEMGKKLRPGGVPLGTRVEWGLHEFWRPRMLNMPLEIREQNPHTLFLGGGAKGKSRLMASMIANDIEGGDRAVVLVDSDGALVDLIMSWIAAHPKGKQIAKRVIVIDPTHDGENICYNPLEFPADGDLQNAASSLVFGFKAVYTEPPGSQSQWNQQTANILRNASVLLIANNRTLTDIPVLLSDNDFRDIMLETVERQKNDKSEYTTLIDAWTNYKRLARTDQWINWIEPILNRVQPMLGDPRIRPILTKAKSDLNLQDIIMNRKVLLVKIPQGQLDQSGNLLGALIVTGVKQAALSLSVRGKDKKRPVSLYLDEFDSFIEKETFDAITSETRKFQIGFCGASKTLQTLPEDYRNQLIINVGMMAVFALAKKDGDMLGPQMFRVDGRKVKHQTIQNVFNKVNSSPQFELISDEEKLNIDRVVGQEERTFFLYRVGTVAGVFHMKAPEFKDVAEKDINLDIIDEMYENRFDSDDYDEDESHVEQD